MACGRVRPRPSLAIHESSPAKSSWLHPNADQRPLAAWPSSFLCYHGLTLHSSGQVSENSKSPAERKNGGANSQSFRCCVYLTTLSSLTNGREHSVAMSRQSRGRTRNQHTTVEQSRWVDPICRR
jgi:hypothetical protein